MNSHNLVRMYVEAFQNPSAEVELLRNWYRAKYSKLPNLLREDFCGSAANCIEWIKNNQQNHAIGIDIDQGILDHAQLAFQSDLKGEQSKRINLYDQNVLDGSLPTAEVAIAFNCSFWIFKKRRELIKYFSNCYETLDSDGMIALQMYCGPEAQSIGTDRLECDGFTAIWEQRSFDPRTNRCDSRIHFELKDGSKIQDAFLYDWRVWSPPECIDLLEEVGFRDVAVHDDSNQKLASSQSPTLFIVAFRS